MGCFRLPLSRLSRNLDDMTGSERDYLFRLFVRFAVVLLVLNATVLWLGARPAARQGAGPRPVRNNVARSWSEQQVLMPWHQRLMPGSRQSERSLALA